MSTCSHKMSRREAIRAVEALALSGMVGSAWAFGEEKAEAERHDAPTDLKQCISDKDREFVERELATFIPDRVFDAHCHLWPPGCDKELVRFDTLLQGAGLKEFGELVDAMHPGRKLGAFFLPSVNTITDSKSRD